MIQRMRKHTGAEDKEEVWLHFIKETSKLQNNLTSQTNTQNKQLLQEYDSKLQCIFGIVSEYTRKRYESTRVTPRSLTITAKNLINIINLVVVNFDYFTSHEISKDTVDSILESTSILINMMDHINEYNIEIDENVINSFKIDKIIEKVLLIKYDDLIKHFMLTHISHSKFGTSFVTPLLRYVIF